MHFEMIGVEHLWRRGYVTSASGRLAHGNPLHTMLGFSLHNHFGNCFARRLLLALFPVFGSWMWANLAFAGAWHLALGVAVFVGGWAIEQLWLFWVAPIIGAAIGALAYRAVASKD